MPPLVRNLRCNNVRLLVELYAVDPRHGPVEVYWHDVLSTDAVAALREIGNRLIHASYELGKEADGAGGERPGGDG